MTKPKRTVKEKFKKPFKSTTVEFWLFLLSVPLSMYVAGIVLMFIVESDKLDANWLSATGSVVAAAITGATLIVIVLQNKKMNQHAESVWRKQEEAMERTFNAEHRNSFNTFLDTLEDEHKGFFKVADRTKLYGLIFSRDVDKFSNENWHLADSHCFRVCERLLEDASDLAEQEIGSHKFGKANYRQWHDDYERALSNASKVLCLENTRPMKAGDVHSNEFVYCNIFYKKMMLHQLGRILSKLSMFANCTSRDFSSDEDDTMTLNAAYLLNYLDLDKLKYKKVVFGHGGFVAIRWLVFHSMLNAKSNFLLDQTSSLRSFYLESSVKFCNVAKQGNEPSRKDSEEFITKLLEHLKQAALDGYIPDRFHYDEIMNLCGRIEQIEKNNFKYDEDLLSNALTQLLPENSKKRIFD